MGEESLVGSEVNLVFRLEKLASSLGEPCCVSASANVKLNGLVETRSIGEFEMKGFEAKCAFFAL
jgi:class 3 adenylate cyclase